MDKPKLIDIKIYEDDRGSVYCAFDDMDFSGIKRTYVVQNFSKGMVRAWHGHAHAYTYMHALNGAVKLSAMKMDEPEDITSFVVTSKTPKMFMIPPGYYNGALSLTDDTKIMVYSTLSFSGVRNDDFRLPWDYLKDHWKVTPR
jgi:dTDP-4-dehydrorhamnose 3,5-epimerase-like enzyme